MMTTAKEIPESVCQTCGGSGIVFIEHIITVPGCCGHFLPTGECCGNAVPLPEQVQEPATCPDCNGEIK